MGFLIVLRRLRINSRAERIARLHDDAAAWLAVHDADRIAAEAAARRAAWRLPEPPGVVGRRKERKARMRLANALKAKART